jgi:hypothetical protein
MTAKSRRRRSPFISPTSLGVLLHDRTGAWGLSHDKPDWHESLRRRSAFVSPTSLGVLLFDRPGVPPPAVHLTAPRLQGVMNQRIFRAIMGIVKGASGVSSKDFCSTASHSNACGPSFSALVLCENAGTSECSAGDATQESHGWRMLLKTDPGLLVTSLHANAGVLCVAAGNVKEGSSFPGGKQPGPEPKAPQRTRINRSFKFGPAARDPVRFRLTVAVLDLRVRGRLERMLFHAFADK